MGIKLTLRIDEELIKAAKKYSAKKGKSLSRLVTDFFRIIQNEEMKKKRAVNPGCEISKRDFKREKHFGRRL